MIRLFVVHEKHKRLMIELLTYSWSIDLLTLKQRVINIDNYANKILSQGGDEALLRSMHDIMGDLKLIMDTARHDELDVLCDEYPGFYRCMKWLENLASGLANGTIPKLPSEEFEAWL